jgi:hypothetical protein
MTGDDEKDGAERPPQPLERLARLGIVKGQPPVTETQPQGDAPAQWWLKNHRPVNDDDPPSGKPLT